MISLDKVLSDIHEQNIQLVPHRMGNMRGATIEVGGRYGIFIDPFAIDTSAELLHILAHETGHCATGATHAVHSPHDLIAKHETSANRWAIRRYLPFAELSAAVQAGHTKPWQLAEYFGLPESFIGITLEYYLEACGLSFPPFKSDNQPPNATEN